MDCDVGQVYLFFHSLTTFVRRLFELIQQVLNIQESLQRRERVD